MGSIPGKGAAHTVANVITTNLYDENKLSIQPFPPVPSQLPVFEKSYKNHAKIWLSQIIILERDSCRLYFLIFETGEKCV